MTGEKETKKTVRHQRMCDQPMDREDAIDELNSIVGDVRLLLADSELTIGDIVKAIVDMDEEEDEEEDDYGCHICGGNH